MRERAERIKAKCPTCSQPTHVNDQPTQCLEACGFVLDILAALDAATAGTETP